MLSITRYINSIIDKGAAAGMTLEEILADLLKEFRASKEFRLMQEAEQYYRNRSAVQTKTNRNPNKSNTRIEAPLLKKLIDQKEAYLLSRPFTLDTENEQYAAALNEIFDASFRRTLKAYVKSTVKSGIAYIQPYIDDEGMLRFMRLPPMEVIPLWLDIDHTQIEGFLRVYDFITYRGRSKETITAVEYWDAQGVRYYIVDDGGKLIPDATKPDSAHLEINGQPFNWEGVPLIWAKYNEDELPLFYFLRELLDDMNWQLSVTADTMRDVAAFVYILKGYLGTDYLEFMKNLQTYNLINVDIDGNVEKINAELDMNAVMMLLDRYRRDIYDFAAGVDTKDPELGNASGTAINFRYMDLENDCQNLGNELRYALERLKPFIDTYLQLTGKGDFFGEIFDVVFNTDLPVEETSIINNIKTSWGMISRKTALSNHPWVDDVEAELELLEAEQQEASEYGEGLFADLRPLNGAGGVEYGQKQQGVLGRQGSREDGEQPS